MYLQDKPLIRNGKAPDEYFSAEEIELIRKTVQRKHDQERGWKPKDSSDQERAMVGDLLRQARFQGYYPNKIDENGKLRWNCMVQCKFKSTRVIITIMPCDKCGVNFHAHHYEDEMPGNRCNKCQKKRSGKVPDWLKRIKHEQARG